MKANKYTAGETSIFEHDIPISHLKVIDGYTFTNREIDIIACMLSGKSVKKIAIFLSISPKTVENHVHNIVLKLGRGSQESVVEFVENSDKFLLIKKHYSNLLVQSIFELELKKLSTLVSTKDVSCSIVYCENNTPPAMIQLEKHLQLFGIQTFVEIQKKDENEGQFINRINSQKPNFIFYYFITVALIDAQTNEPSASLQIPNFIQATNHVREKIIFLLPNISPLTNFPSDILSLNHIDLTKQKNYYYFFFEFLKKLFPNANFDQSIDEFKRKHERINNPFSSEGLLEKIPTLIKKGGITSRNLIRKKTGVLLAVIVFLILLFSLFLFTKKQNSMEGQNSIDINAYPMLSQIKAGMSVTWGLPRQDLLFIGRTKLLNELDRGLSKNPSDSNNVPIVACTGLGGIGKTQLVLQYALHRKDYKLKAWFSAKNRAALEQKYIEFARQLGYEDEKISIESAIFYVKNWLASYGDTLLIFDNVPSYEDISDFLPENGAKIIITTRNQFWPKKIQMLPIDIMSEKEAVELISKVLDRDDPNTKILAEKLGYLPLALAQASAYINYNKIYVAEYLDLYSRYQEEMLADPILPKGSEHEAVALTWNVSIEAIEKKATNLEIQHLARIFLTASSYFAPENIPISVLNRWLAAAYPEIKNPELLTHQLLTELQYYSLLKIDQQGQTCTLNRLVQSVMRNQHQASKINTVFYPKPTYKWFEILLQAINTEFDLKTGSLQDEKRQINFLPHFQRLTTYYEKLLPNENPVSVTLGRSFFNIGNIFLRTGAAKLAKPCYEKALKIQEQSVGKSHPIVGVTLTNLASAYEGLGDDQQAKVFLEDALSILEQHYGKEHPQLISSLTSLGYVHGNLGQDKQAKDILMRALKIAENYLDKNDLLIAEVLTKLSDISSSVGENIQAKNYAERAVMIKERHYGKEHFEAAIPLTNLGAACSYLNEHKSALQHLERALKIQEKHYQKENRDIAITLIYLGRSNLYSGNADKAKKFLEKSLAFFERDNGMNDYYRVINLTLLGETYNYLQNIGKAKELTENALKIAESFFEGAHPETAITQLKLAGIYFDLKETSLACHLAKKSHEVLTESFGGTNVFTVEAYQTLQKCQ